MSKILLASVFFGGTTSVKKKPDRFKYHLLKDEIWCKLQTHFINKTSNSKHTFEKLAVVGPLVNNFDLYEKYNYKVITHKDELCRHISGIHQIFNFFKKSDFDYLCLLDSDAWPIDENWVDLCISWKNKPSDVVDKRCGVAVFRTENFDTYPHPSVFFIDKSFFKIKNKKDFFTKRSLTNLAGWKIYCQENESNFLWKKFDPDIPPDPFINYNLKYFYPLQKTNKLSIHPLCCTVYNNVFYHHVAGSRLFTIRSIRGGCYNNILNKIDFNYEEIQQQLCANPDEFINKLIY